MNSKLQWIVISVPHKEETQRVWWLRPAGRGGLRVTTVVCEVRMMYTQAPALATSRLHSTEQQNQPAEVQCGAVISKEPEGRGVGIWTLAPARVLVLKNNLITLLARGPQFGSQHPGRVGLEIWCSGLASSALHTCAPLPHIHLYKRIWNSGQHRHIKDTYTLRPT